MRLRETGRSEKGEEVLDVSDDIESGGWVKKAMVCADEEDAVR